MHRPRTPYWLFLLLVPALQACFSGSGDGDSTRASTFSQGGECILPPTNGIFENLPEYPVGLGVQPNLVAATFVDQPYEVIFDLSDTNIYTGVYSSVSWGGLIEEPAHGTVKPRSDGVAVYTPEPGFSGYDELAYQVEFGVPIEPTGREYAFRDNGDGSGSERARVLISVIPSRPMGLPACLADCAEVEVVSYAGFGYPTQFLERASSYQPIAYPDAPPCVNEHWIAGGRALQNWGVATGNTGHGNYLIGDVFAPLNGLETSVFGECSPGALGRVDQMPPQTVRVPHAHFDDWCKVQRFISLGALVDIRTDDEVIEATKEPLGLERDWPLWSDEEVVP